MQPPLKQQGMALIMLVFILGLIATGYLLHALNPTKLKIEQDKKTAVALAEAKPGLLGYVLTKSAENVFGYLPNPDMGQAIPFSEGDSAGSAGSKNAIVIGKLPWRSLGISPLKDGANECLWYVVSGHFKNNPKADVLNWDTQGQIDVVDGMGNVLATHLAALIVSPGGVLDSQNRSQKNAASVQCGGNYDARNYLDPFNAEDAVVGVINYFPSTENDAKPTNDDDKTFVLIHKDINNERMLVNDYFLFVTVDEIFNTISWHSAFSAQISALLNDDKFIAQFKTVEIKGDKGMENVNCKVIDDKNSLTSQRFCQGWFDMLLLTDLPASATVKIDNSIKSCSRLLIFGGRRANGQVRLTEDDKKSPVNYLEPPNIDAFNNPSASDANFSGTSIFNANNPSQDIMKCI